MLGALEVATAVLALAAELTAASRQLYSSRALLQNAATTEILAADFERLQDIREWKGNIYFNESSLLGKLPITPGAQQIGEQPLQQGVYDLSPKMVGELVTKVSEQLPQVSPEDSVVVGPLEFPGLQISGISIQDEADLSVLRVPTVYAPFRSGTVFDFGERPPDIDDSLPGVTLRFSNVTMMMENVTWQNFVNGESGLEPFFRLRDNARFCLTNSMLVLKDCTGYIGFDMICCKVQEGCSVKFSQEALMTIYEETQNPQVAETASQLTQLTCHSQWAAGQRAPGVEDGGGGGASSRTTLIAAGTTVSVVLLLIFGACYWMIRKHYNKQKMNDAATGKTRPAPDSMSTWKSDSGREAIQRAQAKRARRARSGKQTLEPINASGYTEHALLDKNNNNAEDILCTQSSPADTPPMEGGTIEGANGSTMNPAGGASAIGAQTHASGSPTKPQQAQNMLRVRSKEELDEPQGASPNGRSNGTRGGGGGGGGGGNPPLKGRSASHPARGGGRGGGAVRGGSRERRGGGRSQMTGVSSRELADGWELDSCDMMPQPMHEGNSGMRGGSPARVSSGGLSGTSPTRRSGKPPMRPSKDSARRPSPHNPRRRSRTRENGGHSSESMSQMHGSQTHGASGSGNLPRVASAPGGPRGMMPAQQRRSGESRRSCTRAGDSGGLIPEGAPGHVSKSPRRKNSHGSHASSGGLKERPQTYDVSQVDPAGEFPNMASELATGGRTPSEFTDSATATRGGAGAAGAEPRRRRQRTAYRTETVEHTETMEARASFMEAPAKGATVEERRLFVMRQLDALGVGHVVLGKYMLLDAGERCHGGQAVVQFATGKLDKQDYAIKFFLSRKGFDSEEALYRHTTLGQFLPTVNASCLEGSIRDPWGRALPACMIMERGEALDLWMDRAQPDKYMAFSMIANMAERVCDLHARGWVHRDLKPANIMWLPRTNRWTVIDFGCAAPRGVQAPLSFTLGYAAPEVAIALTAGMEVVQAEPAMDAWAIGVIAFELLTGRPAFRMEHGKQDVIEQLVGNQELPWEGARFDANVQRKLGAHRKDVLGLLKRDPEQRLTLYQFLNSCSQMLAGTETPAQPIGKPLYDWNA